MEKKNTEKNEIQEEQQLVLEIAGYVIPCGVGANGQNKTSPLDPR
jgi:hypothetical protein